MKFCPEKLIQLRASKKLSQKELATLAGISDKQISRYELGNSKPRKATLHRLANALDVKYEDLLGTEISMNPLTVKFLNMQSKAYTYMSDNERDELVENILRLSLDDSEASYKELGMIFRELLTTNAEDFEIFQNIANLAEEKKGISNNN